MNLHFTVNELAYYCAAFLCLVFSLTLTFKHRKTFISRSFIFAAYVNALALLVIAVFNPIDINFSANNNQVIGSDSKLAWLLIAETLSYCAWIFALTKITQHFCRDCVPRCLRFFAYILSLSLPFVVLALTRIEISSINGIKIFAWLGIFLSVLSLLVLEQLYRNMPLDKMMRFVWLAMSLKFLYDAFLFSQNLVILSLNPTLWQIRASVILVSFILMIIGVLTLTPRTQSRLETTLSQPARFHSSSLSITGVVLIVLAFGGYYVRIKDGTWSAVLYTTIFCSGLIFVLITLLSRTVRRKLNVAINKYLFNYKYDYRNEWLKLIRLLSQPGEHNDYHLRALSISADLFRCDNGILCKKQGNTFISSAQIRESERLVLEEPSSSGFISTLETGWVYTPTATSEEMTQNNDLLPEWFSNIDNVWLILPLLVEDDLTGFIILSDPREDDTPNWEDLDLVKTVGRQVANHIARHDQAELLAQARQFDTFNKLSAFVMHDLKNLIAQQSLVVKNAEKHKDNPAFVDDAINTIKNSVDRMNILLRKLRQNEPEETKVLRLKDLLVDAVKRCQKSQPSPTLLDIEDNIHIKADFDSIVMVFTHLIHNAQDATPSNGFIDIYAERNGQFTSINIEDNGEGMSEDFIRSKLFQPFESTKAGKGMGVGVYQAREYIENLGGQMTVESSQGQGTKFTLKIPLAQA